MSDSLTSRSLIPVPVIACWHPVPAAVTDLIDQAQRIWDQRSADESRLVSLVNSNYYIAFHAIKQQIQELNRPGLRLVELGSGCGVVANIAALLGVESSGIEIEPGLCELSNQLATACKLSTKFIPCSYRDWEGGQTSEMSAAARKGLSALREADLIYGYPWPSEQTYLASVVKQHCKHGARYLTYHGGSRLQLRRVSVAI